MDIFADAAMLARIQFAGTAIFHFIFVPLSIGIGLFVAIAETRYYRHQRPEDAAASKLWVKIFTATFIVGVATGITLEFSFGTNWADYSRFVGDIFGAPLAAEALFAFFLESVFLGILIFGRKKVSRKFYLVSAWLVWFGSCLSALWILIANSWMQTPAGAELAPDGSRAVMTDFFAAAFNPSTLARYSHVVVGVIIMGAFIAMAIAAWYMLKNRNKEFAVKTLKTGSVVALVFTCVMLVTAHSSAVVVAEEQPTKLAMMEGMYNSEVADMYLFGWVDEETQEVISPLKIPGGVSFLASGSWDTEYQGLNQLAETEAYKDMVVEDQTVNAIFQSYHLMVIMFGLIALSALLAIIFSFKKNGMANKRWLQRLLVIAPLFPFIAIHAGWITAELGRQPWVVYPSTSSPDGVALLTNNGTSLAVSAPEIMVTLILFFLVYLIIFIAWVRIVSGFIKRGPELEEVSTSVDSDGAQGVGTAPVNADASQGTKEGA